MSTSRRDEERTSRASFSFLLDVVIHGPIGAPNGAPSFGPLALGTLRNGWPVGGGVSNVRDRPSLYEFRGKLQIQILCGADDNPRGRMNT